MIIELSNVSVLYQGVPALNEVTYTFDGTGVVLLTGATGSGKTTLLRLLYADLSPTSGSVSIDGAASARFKTKDYQAVRRRLGIVQQDCKLVRAYTVFENVMMPFAVAGLSKPESTTRCLDLLADMNISYIRHKMPDQLSGGERHLVAIARAIALKPEIVIADEPTGTLDDTTSARIADTLKACVRSGTGLIVSTHSSGLISAFPEAQLCTLSDGRMI